MEKIVVGVSETSAKHPAIEWAMQYAHGRDASVQLVHVIDTTWGDAPQQYSELALLTAEEKLRDKVEAARRDYPGTAVGSHVAFGSAAGELAAAAGGADLLVIGAHPDEPGDGASRLAVRLARIAPCSVVVAPSDVVPQGAGVVVGVDGSEESELAVAFAAAYADRFGQGLTAVLAWGHPEAWGITDPALIQTEPSEYDRLTIAESIAGLASQYPDLVVTSEVSASRPEHALANAARGARLLVVGSRGRNPIARVLLGSVSEGVVAALPCAVAVVRS